MARRKGVFAIVLVLTLISTLLTRPVAYADPDCADVYVLGARGSGEDIDQNDGLGRQLLPFWRKFQQEFAGRAPDKTVAMEPIRYPAVSITNGLWAWLTGLNAYISKDENTRYHRSVENGKQKVVARVTELIARCDPKTEFVLAGYSQGGQAVANAYQELSQAQRNRVRGAFILSDPLFNGQTKKGRGNYNPHRNGVLIKNNQPRPEYPPSSTLVLSYCQAYDPVCQGLNEPGPSGHRLWFDPLAHTNYFLRSDEPGWPTYPELAATQIAGEFAPPSPAGQVHARVTKPMDTLPNTAITLSGGQSWDTTGQRLTFAWDLENSGFFGPARDEAVIETMFPQPGSHTVRLKVTNETGHSQIATGVVKVLEGSPFTGPPGAPTDVVATPAPDAKSATITFQPPATGPPAESYELYSVDGSLVDSEEQPRFVLDANQLPLTIVVQASNRMGPGGTSPPVVVTVPGPGTPVTGWDGVWNAYGDQGGHWTGGDRTASVVLPDGRTAWLFSDTFLGTVNADHSRPANTPMVHNTIVVGTGQQLTSTLHGGTPAAPQPLVDSPADDYAYWVADGIVNGGSLKVLYTKIESAGGGVLDLNIRGTALATFSLPSLTLTSLVDVSPDTRIAWGQELVEENGYVYIYGSEGDGDGPKYLHLARTPVGDLDGPWTYWTGSTWSVSQNESVRMLTGVGQAFSVTKMGSEYALVTMDGNTVFSTTMMGYSAPALTGPFGNPRTLYQAPDHGPGKSIVVYDATAHPQFSSASKLLVSYNVNSLDPAVVYQDARIYRPRFVEVNWQPGAPDPEQLPGPPTNLTAVDNEDGSARLAWQPSSDTTAVYRVYQRDVTFRQDHFTRLSASYPAPVADVAFLRDGHDYEFYVTAENTAGESPPTNVVRLHIQMGDLAPPRNLRATANDTGGVQLTWDRTPSPGLVWYKVLRRSVAGIQEEFAPINFPNSTNNSVLDVGLSNNTVYEYKVTANRTSQESPPSNVVQVTARVAPPGPPTNLRATPRSDGGIDLVWEPPAGQHEAWYWVYQRDVSVDQNAPFTKWGLPVMNGPAATAKYLKHGNTYEFMVSATTVGGEGDKSAPVRAKSTMQKPEAPTNLTATANWDATIRLDWTPPPGDVWFWVWQKDLGAEHTEFVKWPYPVTGGSTATAQYLTAGHEYEFQVAATNAAGDSEKSNIARARAKLPKPPPPTGLTLTPNSNGTITLSWTAPQPNLWYFVYQRTLNTDFTKWEIPITEGTSATAEFLTHGTVYEFKVSSTGPGGESEPTPPKQATANWAKPGAPTGLEVRPQNNGSAQLSWHGLGANAWYYVHQRDVTLGHGFHKWLVTEPQAVADPLLNGHEYEFMVSATNPGGEGPTSSTVRIVARGGTPNPPNLSVSPGDGRAFLSWSASGPPGTYYFVYRKNLSAGQRDYTKFGPTDQLSHVDTWLENGSYYEYRVSASNEHGEGGWSAPQQVRPLPPPPGTPSGLSASAGDGFVTLRWNGVPNAWYIVEHRNVSAGQGWQSTETLSANTTWTHTYLTNGNVYEYRIRAKNMAGVSGPSNMASAKPMPPFPQPTSDLVAEGGDAKVFLSWRASPTPNVMYWVEYRESGSSSWVRLPYPVYCCSLTVNYMANNKVYWFRVITANITGEAAPTPERGARPMPPVPAPPTNLVAWGVKGGAELRWSPSPTQTGLLWYRIWYRNATAGHGWTEAFWGTSGTSNLQQYLTPFHNYEFAVQAVTESGRSGFSNVATAQPWVPVHDPQPYRPKREGVPGPATGWLYIGNNTYAQYQAQRMELYWTVNDAGARMQHWRAVTDIYRTQYCDVFGCGPLSSWKPTPCGYPAPVWWNLLTRCDAASRVWFQYVTRPPGPFPQHPI